MRTKYTPMLSELRDLGDRFYKATNFHINSFGGEGAIRTLQPRLASASYSVVVAASATFAIIAVAHCPKVPKSIAAGARRHNGRALCPGEVKRLEFSINSLPHQ